MRQVFPGDVLGAGEGLGEIHSVQRPARAGFEGILRAAIRLRWACAMAAK